MRNRHQTIPSDAGFDLTVQYFLSPNSHWVHLKSYKGASALIEYDFAPDNSHQYRDCAYIMGVYREDIISYDTEVG